MTGFMVSRRHLLNVVLLGSERWVSLGLVFSIIFLFFPAHRGRWGGDAQKVSGRGRGRGGTGGLHHIYIVWCHIIY